MGLFSKKEKLAAGDDDAAKNSLFGGRKAPPSPSNSFQNPYAAPPPPYGAHSSGTHPSVSGDRGPPSTVDPNRDALFNSRQPGAVHQPSFQSGGYGKPHGHGQPNGYGQPGKYQGGGYDRNDGQVSAQDEEDEDVEAVKQQIRFTKNQTVLSSRNALTVAAKAEESGRNTLARLGQQGELLHTTEKNLDVAASHSRVADEKARELKSMNRSMFAMHIHNPMRSKSLAKAEEQNILELHQSEREERDRVRKTGFEGKGIVGNALKNSGGTEYAKTQMSVAERSKYQFEADESDDEKEKEIHNNLDQLSAVTARLKGLARATGEEVDRQNKQISGIMAKSDKVDDQIAVTHNKIKKFR